MIKHIHIVIQLFFVNVLFMVNCQAQTLGIFNHDVAKSVRITNESQINTPNLEFSPCFFDDKIAFVFADVKSKFFDPNINESFFDIGFATMDENGNLSEKQNFEKNINSQYHEGPMAFDAISNKLYFTRAAIEKRRIKGILRDTSVRKIMIADFTNQRPVVKECNLNHPHYSVCHPTLSRDGKTMIFASDQKNGMGKMDLYAAYFDGVSWGGEVHLGAGINSADNEFFPFLYNDTLLIFASDREGGMGGIDMYASVMYNGIWSLAERLPEPLNSNYDDLGLILNDGGKSGYFSSNRPGGKGKDDIYSFLSVASLLDKEGESDISVNIHILDKFSFEPVHDAEIVATELEIDSNDLNIGAFNIDILSGPQAGEMILKLSPKKGFELPLVTSDDKGDSKILLKRSKKYLIRITSDQHESFSLLYDFRAYGSDLNIVLEPQSVGDDEVVANETPLPVVIPEEIGAKVIFENIYYDYNSAIIKEGAAAELDALVDAMLKNPNLQVRLEAHTDSRGTEIYNLNLSHARAVAAKMYLIKQGIASERIQTFGYGETNLRNHCKDGINCSEEEHRYNRRTEVIILGN